MKTKLARIGGGVALAVTGVIAILLATTSDEGFNVANIATLLAGAIGGGLALRWPNRSLAVASGAILLLVGAVPALIGGVGLLYLPSIILLVISALKSRSAMMTGRVEKLERMSGR
jgi:hypothetical protein